MAYQLLAGAMIELSKYPSPHRWLLRLPLRLLCLALAAMLLTAAPASARPRGGVASDEQLLLARFYAPRAYAPVWGGSASALASEALALLARAEEQGLSPADYLVDTASDNAARFDAALTVALLRYLRDLHGGRADPGLFPPGAASPSSFDAVETLRAALASGKLQAAVRAAEPPLRLYQRLKASLAQYRTLALRPLAPIPAPSGVRVVEPGTPYQGASALRQLLLTLGDLDAVDATGADGDYTVTLAAALARFQDRHGLRPDGRLGPQTLAALNVPLAQRVRQIVLSLERLRWLPPLPYGPVLAVNIPSFRLWAYRAGETDPALAMRVIVGGAGVHQTPLFIGKMRWLEFHPYWNIPSSIVRGEILPELARDGDYLQRHDMELVDRQGKVAAVAGSAAVAGLRSGVLRVRQRPGPRNALGVVKFAMPNAMDIYLHSTPAPRLFDATQRDFSHGCIRVEDAAALAAFVLHGNPQWTPATVAAAMAAGAPRTVPLPTVIPVILFYATALADHEGRTLFSNDIYGLDQALAEALASRI